MTTILQDFGSRERAELHRTYIGGVERGERNISLFNLLRIARGLGVSPADLVDGGEAAI